MMVGRMLGDISCKLSDLYFVSKITFEAGKENFPLGGFQSIHNGRNRPNVIGIGKMDQLFINKILDRDNFDI